MAYFPAHLPDLKEQASSQIAGKLFQLEKAVESFDVRLEYGSDFRIFRKSIDEIPETIELTGIFDDRCSDIGRENGLWVQARDSKGNVVHRQAMRHDKLMDTTLAEHWLKNVALYAPSGFDIDFSTSELSSVPIANIIAGSVCYHGDLWMGQDYRNMELASFLSKSFILKNLLRFSPDFVYGMVMPNMVERGWAARAGYFHMHPWAPRWYVRDQSDFYDEYIVWVSGQELVDLCTAGKGNIDVLSRVYISNDHGRATSTKHITG